MVTSLQRLALQPCSAPVIVLGLLCGALFWACDGAGQQVTDDPPHVFATGPLVDNELWEFVAPLDDPLFPANADDVVVCDGSAAKIEQIDDTIWFDVTTTTCNYVTVRQPSLMATGPGAVLTVWIFHFKIVTEPGEYHLMVQAGDPPVTLWEDSREVPNESKLWFEEIVLADPIDAGTPITYHVSNHGQNTWGLVGLLVDYPEEVAE